jgi:hypothetical protein
MAVELFNNGTHACLAFYDLVDEEADHAVQCNQFLIVDGSTGPDRSGRQHDLLRLADGDAALLPVA